LSNALAILASRLEGVERKLRAQSAPQLANSSVEEGGAIDVNEDGQTVMQLGGQFDGTFVASTLIGPTPPTPTAAILEPAPGAIIARWDGTFTDALTAPMDWARTEVHASSDLTARDSAPFDASTLRATIETARGTEVALLLPSELHSVWFVARTLAGKYGLPSEAATETPATVGVDQSVLDGIDAALDAAQAQVDAVSLEVDGIPSLISTAKGEAITSASATAQAKADLAQAAAIAAAATDATTKANAPNHITVTQLADDAVTSPKIIAGAVVAGKLAADSVLATNIKAGEVVAGKLAADSVVATNVAADAILARNIKAGEITAAKMVAGTITAASGVIGDISATKITSGTLDAARISANSITVEQLRIGALDNLAANPFYLDSAAGWTSLGGGAGTAFVTTANRLYAQAAMSAKLVQAGSGTHIYGPLLTAPNRIPISPGEAITANAMVYADGSSAISLRIEMRLYFYDLAGTNISNLAGGNIAGSAFTASTWTKVGGLPVVAPAGAVTVSPRLSVYMNAGTPTATSWFVGPYTVRRAVTGELIVDGAIDGRLITGATIRTAATGRRWELGSTVANMLLGYPDVAGVSSPGSLVSDATGDSVDTFLNSPMCAGGGASLSLSSPRPGYEANGAEAGIFANGTTYVRASEKYGVVMGGKDLTFNQTAIPLGLVNMDEQVVDSSSASSVTQVWTGMSLTFQAVAGRRYKVSVLGGIKSTVAGDRGSVIVRDDPGGAATPSYVFISQTVPMAAANSSIGVNSSIIYSHATGTVNLFVYLQRVSGTGTVRLAGASTPSQLVVEDIGRMPL